MKTYRFLLAAMLFSSLVHAEIRTWEDIHGNVYEGEFVKEMFEKMTIREASGKMHTIAIKDLSDLDKQYIRTSVPPELTFDISRNARRKPLGASLWKIVEDSHFISAKIVVSRKSQRPYTSRLNAEFYLIGKAVENNSYLVLSRTTDRFLLTEKNEYQYSFTTDEALVSEWLPNSSSSQRRGESYKGYLLVIRDYKDHITQVESNGLPDWMESPEVLDNLRDLSKRGAASMRSRYFSEETKGKKAPVPTGPMIVPHQP